MDPIQKKCGRGKHGHFLLRQAGWKTSAHSGIEFSSVFFFFFGTKYNLCVHPAEQAELHVCNGSGKAKGNNYVTTFNFVWVCDYKSNLCFYTTQKRLSEISAIKIHPSDSVWIKFRLILRSFVLALLLLRLATCANQAQGCSSGSTRHH